LSAKVAILFAYEEGGACW